MNIFQVLKQTGESEALPHSQSAFFSFKLQVDHCWEIQQVKLSTTKHRWAQIQRLKIMPQLTFSFFPNFTRRKTPLDISFYLTWPNKCIPPQCCYFGRLINARVKKNGGKENGNNIWNYSQRFVNFFFIWDSSILWWVNQPTNHQLCLSKDFGNLPWQSKYSTVAWGLEKKN